MTCAFFADAFDPLPLLLRGVLLALRTAGELLLPLRTGALFLAPEAVPLFPFGDDVFFFVVELAKIQPPLYYVHSWLYYTALFPVWEEFFLFFDRMFGQAGFFEGTATIRSRRLFYGRRGASAPDRQSFYKKGATLL